MTSDSPVEGWLDRLLGLRRGERGAALVLMFTGALLIAGMTIAKSIRDSLFLDAYPAQHLPIVLIAIAVLTAPVVSAYTQISNRVPFRILAPGFYMIVAIGFMLMERLYAAVGGWAAIALYLYVNLLGLLGVVQFWLLVGWRFNTRETRRLIGVLGTGSVIGGLVGGLLARSLSTVIHPEAILWIVAAMYAGAGLATDWVTRQHQGGSPAVPPSPAQADYGIVSGLRQISRDPLLRYVVALVLIAVTLGNLTDLQLKFVAQDTYPTKVEMVRFFGGFYATIGVVTLILQLGLTPYLMRRWGVAGALLTLPLALLPGAGAMLLAPGIAAAVVLRGGDQGVRNSSFRSGYEILFLPLAPDLRRQAKPLVDVFVERTSDGISGLVLLLLTTWIGLAPRGLAWVTLALCLVISVVIIRLRRAYVATLEKNLSIAVLTDARETPVVEHGTLQTIEVPTFAAQDSRLLQSLEVSSRLGSMKDLPLELLKHPSAPIRDRAMALLEAYGAGKPPTAEEIDQLRTEAQSSQKDTKAVHLISEAQIRLPTATPLAPSDVFSRLVDGKSSDIFEALTQLERQGDPRLASALLPLLEDRRYRDRVESVLKSFGPSVAGMLGDILLNDKASIRVRRHVARVLGELDSPLAEYSLKKALLAQPGEVRRAVSTALYIMRSRGYSKGLDVDELQELLEPEVQRNLAVWEADTQLQRSSSSNAGISRDAVVLSVRETKSRTLRHLFRLLGLCFPPDAIQAAYKGLTAGNSQVRDQALEYLDNVLPEKLRQLVWPLMDPEARFGERPKQRDVEHIMMDLLRSGVTIDLPREALDLSMEPSSEE